MLDNNIINESTSSWSFPVCIVPKAGKNEYRFAIDFRKLNEITARDNFPLPNINDTLDSLGLAKPQYFTTLDLASGYWQIGLAEDAKPKTAFIAQDGLYEFQRMPFGLHNAPSTFQRAMQEIFRGLNWKFVLVYLDDLIIFSRTFDEHLSHLRQVFDRIRAAGLKLKPKKCTFGQEQVKYLGHIVNKDGVATDPVKVQIIKDYPCPTKVSEVRSFLGLVGYYRKYIKDYCKIAEPLVNLTRKDTSFVWSKTCQDAFEELKQKLQEPPVLVYPRFDGTEFILQTDASNVGLGFILAQQQDGEEKVISYGGRTLSKAERKYSTTELEALAVVEDLLYRQWQVYGKKTTPEQVVTQLYIPVCFVDIVLSNCHDHVLAAHFGLQKTYHKVRQRYFWKSMYRDIDNWVRSCRSCSQRKTHRHKVVAPLVTMKVPDAFERVSVDVLGPLPITTFGNRYVLCFTDHCTRWPILVPLATTNAATIARALFDYVICEHGCPVTLLSDRGANFLSNIVREVCLIMQTQKLNTSSYHPQCNAVQERFNSVILDTVSHYVNEFQTNWDQYITAIQFAYRSTPADNSIGFSPFFLLYGREARLPLDVALISRLDYQDKTLRDHIHNLVSKLEVFRDVSKRHTEENQAKMKERYDETTKQVEYQVGDLVWIYFPVSQKGLSKKLMKLWAGPYLIVQRTGPVNFRVRNLENHKLLSSPIHVNRMKFVYDRYVRPNNDIFPADPQHRTSVDDLVQEDCPEDSFVALKAKQKTKNPIQIVPGWHKISPLKMMSSLKLNVFSEADTEITSYNIW
ncbi:uncharacterized protein K02A2.6-like [Patiria miniata]|uniref:Uncharacterized protein n=1 Tax=Patiria miniata TaxID=46514 RepID=A0A913Z9B9_PATMI|nr:uncharacterized protein K02A2.6-like [Patiria miniata]